MKKVLLFGVFDMFHFGHLRLIKRASKLGDYLIVGVQKDEYILRFKPPGAQKALYSTEERVEMVRALRVVDEVVPYGAASDAIREIDFDIFVKGPDQMSDGVVKATEWCNKNGKDVIILPRTDGISSTYLKQLVNELGGQ